MRNTDRFAGKFTGRGGHIWLKDQGRLYIKDTGDVSSKAIMYSSVLCQGNIFSFLQK